MPATIAWLRRGAALLLPLFVAFEAHAALPAGVTLGQTVEGITEYRLAIGLKVLLFPDAS
jgi:zinc protease